MPDIPKLVSFDFLRRINAEPAGKWMGQPKYDGWRRIITPQTEGWQYNAKNHKELREMPLELRNEFERSFGRRWLKGKYGAYSIDAEWVGPRSKNGENFLYIFDCIIPNMSFADRYQLLYYVTWGHPRHKIILAPMMTNPDLVDLYLEQLTDPLTEGIVVRRSDSKIVGHPKRCVENPYWFKVKFRN